MSTHDDNLKKQLDDLLSSREFPFEQPAWEQMAGLLDQKKRKRRFLYFFWIGLTAGLAGLMTLYILNDGTPLPKTTGSENVMASTADTQSREAPLANPNANTPSSKPINSAAPEEKPLVSEPPAKNNLPFQSPQDTKLVASKVSTPLPNNIRSQSPQNTKSLASPIRKEPASVSLAEVAQTSNNKKNAATENKLPLSIADPAPLAPLPNKEPDAKSSVKKDEALISAVATTNVSAVEPVPAEKINDVSANNIQTLEEDAPDQVINKKDAVAETTPEAPVAAPDTALQMKVAKPDTDYVHRRQPDIRLEAGGSLMSGWMDKGRRDAFGINPLAGLHYYLPIGRDLQFGIGLQYTQTAYLKYSKYTATVTRVDLGRTVKATEFTPTRLHYLLLPMRLAMRMDEKQTAGIGLNTAYLLTADSKVSEYTQDRNGISQLRTYKVKGYTEGFSDFDAQLCFFYQRRLGGRFRLNTELIIGVRDVKNGRVLPSETIERNNGIRISLHYALFENK